MGWGGPCPRGYTNGYTITLVLACCSWQHLAEYKQNTMVLGLLGRTILSPIVPTIPTSTHCYPDLFGV
jgi:hypothetical protein